MTTGPLTLTDELRCGRRVIDSLPNVTLLSDLKMFEGIRTWGMLCRISVDTADPTLVPADSIWWVLLSPEYPWGRIRFYPAISDGITGTHPHQSYNGIEDKTFPWRSGDICLNAPQFVFERSMYNPDPIGTSDRIRWYFSRAEQWLLAASRGELLGDGELFELPVFLPETLEPYTVAINETVATWKTWQNVENRVGLAEVVVVGDQRLRTVAVREFTDVDDNSLVTYDWGTRIEDASRKMARAVWIRLPTLPVTKPYEAPHTWGELLQTATEQNEDLFQLLREVCSGIRDGEPHLLLLGFPVSRRMGQPPCRMYWQSALLPVVSHGQNYADGFRKNAEGYWRRDRVDIFKSRTRIQWQTSENWADDPSTSRGRMDDSLSVRDVLLVGAGAVGGVAAELLVRASVRSVLVMDDDDVTQGNLCRHVLGMTAIGTNKADALCGVLTDARPGAIAGSIPRSFPPQSHLEVKRVQECSLILDCTGSDAALHELGTFDWQEPRFFCSISISYQARRVYVFTAVADSFPVQAFEEQVAPWLRQDVDQFGDHELVQDGIGCWHAAFPARIDDIWMLTAAGIRRLEEAVSNAETEPRLVVFEQVLEDGRFNGIRRI